ncbi:hypothetical protein EDF74_2449 [Stenotrophomonas rhizophila]|uniref:hypothetical protein n=1 Tax=Stenotrophomonas rhizophila TaxID=216778 RepID=UPI000F4CF860|nr:hypothetical protein [Stenotrophomonas rhizophila]ROP76789.1 hypothetical protein EDF74_2449 [Stenotrophomonas rhizophila]
MSQSSAIDLPSIPEMLGRVKLQESRKTGRKDRCAVIAMSALLGVMAAVVAVAKFGWMGMVTAKYTVVLLYALLVLVYATWVALMLVEVFNQVRAGFRQAAQRVDRQIAHQRELISWLSSYPRELLRERAMLVELESKSWTRRAGIGVAFGAAFTVGLSLLAAAVKVNSTSLPSSVPTLNSYVNTISVTVYAVMFGLLLGSAMACVFAARLEKVAGVFKEAAERGSAV